MRCLVTGGAGFIGGHIVETLLAAGHTPVVLDHRLEGKDIPTALQNKVKIIRADVLDPTSLADVFSDCDAVFHLAALVGVTAYSEKPEETAQTELRGLHNICEGAIAAGVRRIVYASSSAVYGEAGGSEPIREDLQITPVSNYGKIKRDNEIYLEALAAKHPLSATALRIFNVYGPRQDTRLAIPRFIDRALANQPIELFGSGAQTRDFIYVKDVAAAAIACAVQETRGFRAVNAASGKETAIAELADMVVKLCGSTAGVVSLPVPANRNAYEVQRSCGSRARLEALSKVTGPTPLLYGLGATVDYMRDKIRQTRQSG